jgi:hypothetical protein
VGSLEKEPADFGMIQVWNSPIGLSNDRPDYQVKEPRHMCPGTSATFTSYELASRSRVSFDIQDFALPALNHGQLTVINNP